MEKSYEKDSGILRSQEKKKRPLPRERLKRKIQANNERERLLYEMRTNKNNNPKMTLPIKQGPNLAEKIFEKKLRHQYLRRNIYNYIEDLENRVDYILDQLIGNNSNEPYIDPDIWRIFTSEQFKQEIDTFLAS